MSDNAVFFLLYAIAVIAVLTLAVFAGPLSRL
jgi:hypothetical protein